MSKNPKCPCCGSEMRKTTLGDVHAWHTCHNDECAFNCRVEHLPRIAAAMELAKAEANLNTALEGKDLDDALQNVRGKHERVLEVFGV